MFSLVNVRSSDICFRLYEDVKGSPYLLKVSVTVKEVLEKVKQGIAESGYTGLNLTNFDSGSSLHIEANENYDLTLVAEAMAEYWASQDYVVARKRGTLDSPYDVETFLLESDRLRASKGKYTKCYGLPEVE